MTRSTAFKKLCRIAGASIIVAILVLSLGPLNAEEGHEGHDHSSEEPATNNSHAGHDDAEAGHADHLDEVTVSPEAMETFGITVEKLTPRMLTETVVAPARVAYNGEAMAHVGSPVAGRAGELKVRLGDVVEKGDVLAIIESQDLGGAESALLQSRSLREAAVSAVEVSKLAFQRAEELRKTNSVSVTDLLSRQGELKKAEGELKVAVAAYLAAENRLHILGISQAQVERLLESGEVTSRFELRAPIAGTVILREVTPGEVVGPDREALMVIADMQTLWVLADVPERVAHRVMAGSRGRITLGLAEGAELKGTVSYVAPSLNPKTRTAQVRLVVDAAEAVILRELATSAPAPVDEGHAGHDHDSETSKSIDHSGHDHGSRADQPEEETKPATVAASRLTQAGQFVRPGQFARVELELGSIAGAASVPVLAVPEDAVQTVEGREAVFIPADEPNTFTPAPLTLGRRIGRYYPVLSGLKDGDSYVAKGSFLLKAEMGKEGAEHEH